MRRAMLWLMILCLLPFAGQMGRANAESGTFGDLTWELDKQGVLTVNGTGSFPARGPWMEHAKKIKEIEVGDGIESVSSGAFSGLPALTAIHLGAGIKQIGVFAFSDVPKLKKLRMSGPVNGFGVPVRLTEVILDENPDATLEVDGIYVTAKGGNGNAVYCIGNQKGTVVLPRQFRGIAMYAFSDMKNMKAIVLGDKISGIYNYAFKGCTGLTAVTLPKSLSTLGDGIFDGCKALKTVVFLGEKVNLGKSFSGCSGLQEIILPAVETLKAECFKDCAALKTAVIGSGTVTIEANAFIGCKKLTTVRIPASVTSIAEEAFDASLKKLTVQGAAGSAAEAFAAAKGYAFEAVAPVESITLTESEATVEKGKNLTLKAELLPAKKAKEKVIWASDNEQVATVKDGRVKALAGGEADIYCLAADGSGVRAVCHVNVSEQIKSLQAAEKKHSMTVGETWQPEIIIQPETATNRIVVWNSSDESVCTVDETGLVTAVGKGKCVISCAATDGSKKTGKINVTVTE